MKQETKQTLALYTASAEPEVAEVAARIAAGTEGSFQTRIFTHDGKGAGFVSWREAWRHPEKDSWTVENFSRFSGEAEPVRKATLARGVCFFDALHSVATFEESEKASGAQIAEGRMKHPHYTQAAQSACVPLDAATGMPAPAAHGRILADGLFSEEATELAEQGRARALLPASDGRHITAALTAFPASAKPAALLEEARRVQEVSEVFARALDLGQGPANGFHIYAMGLGGPRYYLKLRSTFTRGAGLLAELAAIHAPGQSQIPAFRSFERSLSRLPEGGDREVLTAFSKAMQASIYLEAAGNASRDDNSKYPDKMNRFGLSLIDAAVKYGGVPQEQAPELKQRFLNRSFPPENAFAEIAQGDNSESFLGRVKMASESFRCRHGLVKAGDTLNMSLKLAETLAIAVKLGGYVRESLDYRWVTAAEVAPGKDGHILADRDEYYIALHKGLGNSHDWTLLADGQPLHLPHCNIPALSGLDSRSLNLPSSGNRDLLRAFSKAAEKAIYLECAIKASRETEPADAEKLQKFGCALIDAGVRAGGGAETAMELKRAFLDKTLPPEGTFAAAVWGGPGEEDGGLVGRMKRALDEVNRNEIMVKGPR